MEDRNRITRLHTLLVVCLVLFAVLLGRMVYLQLWRGDYYAKQSDGNRLRQSRILAPRGIIYDSEGKELVNNLPGYAVVLQKQSSYKPETLQRLSNLLQMPVEEINAKIKASENFYEPIMLKNNLDQQMVTKIEEQRRYMPEVMLSVQPIRNYPYHELAVHALGYVGEVSSYEIEQGLFKNISQGSLVGKGGLEKTYDKYLRGEDGAFMEEVDVAGNVVKHYDSVQPIPGKNLKLTIDYELQKELEAFTDKHLAFLRSSGIAPGARAAAVVAIDPRNGAVRAMVSRPGYDPNWFVHGISSKNWNSINNDPNYPMNNKVITGEYPPGSTFKIVTGSAAFELKKVGLNEPIFDGGFHPMVPTMGNAGGEVLGWLTFIKALAMSDNVYFYELGYRVGIDNIEKYAHIFGFGERTGIDLEGESKGLVASKKVKREIWDEDWRLGDTFNAAIGQGFNLTTPIQLSVMLSIVANGGTKYQPYLVDSIINSDGSLFEKPKRAEGKHIDVSQQTIDYIRMGMSATTQEGGTASYFAGLPKPIAGKTGTAENSHGRDHGLFVAYGPVDDPELVVVCIVEQGGFGSVAAGPIVYKAFEEFFQEKGYMPRPDKAAPKKDTIQ
ncbi:penicillin-binding protein 2 [Phascolarctobacterium succinatutens]|jgi:penicillin-binding protein 2|uniref:penicillin-binding protein 2 n=2 Tax=Phascolarctobacterium succinatutens TaxID=626940 RepID=UPI00201B66DA|nr:penicillin-binding protein 2 [Phascolarctobacterium succinatutens]MCI6544341.1 penicillin-binding protein 2 [Phascolarctobacterium succinatutens]MDD7140754.1 penicillin-binding protein 2 [Phascolarctobacterium succinatutens]MDY3841159.1 penicillin-binding protein 2 [Phascolarctobacterium succinatutens]UQT42530.1 penicillin-binding protein 2 [Phascolarctobacterium succinatutens]